MKNLIFTLSLLCLTIFAHAQNSNYTAIPLFTFDGIIPRNIEILQTEMKGEDLALKVIISTVGGVQRRLSSGIIAGGKEPTQFKSIGSIVLDKNGDFKSKDLKWLKVENTYGEYNYTSVPLNGIDALIKYEIIATEEDVISTTEFNKLIEEFSAGEDVKVSFVEEPKEPIERYYTALQSASLKGELKGVTLSAYVLRDNEDKSLFSRDYKADHQIVKFDHDEAFPENKFMSFDKSFYTDPVTGNMLVYTGVNHKKDKTKKHNKFFEHYVLLLSKEGNLLSKEVITNEVGWRAADGMLIGGENVPGTNYKSLDRVVFIQDQPTGNKNPEGSNDKRRAVVVNNQGKIEQSVEYDVRGGLMSAQLVSEVDDYIFILSSLSNDKYQALSIHTIGDAGLVEELLIDDTHPRYKEMDFVTVFGSKKMDIDQEFFADNGDRVVITKIWKPKSTSTTSSEPEFDRYFQFFMYQIDKQGKVTNFKTLNRQNSKSYAGDIEAKIVHEDDERYVFAIEEIVGNSRMVNFEVVNKSDFSSKRTEIEVPILDTGSYFYNPVNKNIYAYLLIKGKISMGIIKT